MRKINYISPSGLSCWLKDPDEYYVRYIADAHPPRLPQTQAMAAGAVFDREMKKKLGFEHNPVEEQWESWAAGVAPGMVQRYLDSGVWARFLTDFGGLDDVEMESKVVGTVCGVPLLGKPDLWLPRVGVLLDWKVNGFLSKTSPKKGYIDCDGKVHKICNLCNEPWLHNAEPFESYAPDWALQLATYGLLTGAKFYVVHQLAGPDCRVAEFRGYCSEEYYDTVLDWYKQCWEYGLVENQRLERRAAMMLDTEFSSLTRSV